MSARRSARAAGLVALAGLALAFGTQGCIFTNQACVEISRCTPEKPAPLLLVPLLPVAVAADVALDSAVAPLVLVAGGVLLTTGGPTLWSGRLH